MTAPLFAGIGGHHSARSKTDEWLTPPAVLDALGGWEAFDLDPCAPIVRPWPTARAHLSRVDNGLLRGWDGDVWMNPPYSRVAAWLARLAAHGRGLALIFARTEIDAWHRYVWPSADALFFFRGRLDFCLPDGAPAPGNAGAPSVLCAYGRDAVDRLAALQLPGTFEPRRVHRLMLVAALDPTWREVVLAWLQPRRGMVSLSDLYRALASHPKARRNPNYRAKIRQVLQQGPFRRVARGQWSAA